jgi:hypothetical protein
LLRQQTWGNRFYFSSFPVPVLEEPTYVGPEGIPRVLGAEGAVVDAVKENPFLEVGALPRMGPGQPGPLSPHSCGVGATPRALVGGVGQHIKREPFQFCTYLETAQAGI